MSIRRSIDKENLPATKAEHCSYKSFVNDRAKKERAMNARDEHFTHISKNPKASTRNNCNLQQRINQVDHSSMNEAVSERRSKLEVNKEIVVDISEDIVLLSERNFFSSSDNNQANSINNLKEKYFMQSPTKRDAYLLDNSEILQEENSLLIPAHLRRKRRSRHERSTQRLSAMNQSSIEHKAPEDPCSSMRIVSPDCSNQEISNQGLTQDQVHDQTIDNFSIKGFISTRAPEEKDSYLQSSIHHGRITKTAKLLKKEETDVLSAYRSVQERPVTKSCENRPQTHRGFSGPDDSKTESVFSILRSLRLMGSQTYRGNSEHQRKICKKGALGNKSVCLSSRVSDKNESVLNREINSNGLQTQRRLLAESLRAGYGDLAKTSKLGKKTSKKVGKSFDKENGTSRFDKGKRDETVSEVPEDKVLKIIKPSNVPQTQRKNSSGATSQAGLKSFSKGVINQVKHLGECGKETRANCLAVKEKDQKIMKFPSSKTAVESTYYEEFIRKKKLNEKLLQPRNKNYESTTSRENYESITQKPKTIREVSKDQGIDYSLIKLMRVEKDGCLVKEEPKRNSRSQEKFKPGSSDFMVDIENNKCVHDKSSSLMRKKEVKDSSLVQANLGKEQDKQALPRIDMITDKTIIEKTYMEKANIKNKGFAEKPMINVKKRHPRKQSEEGLIEFEHSQADSLTYREERSICREGVQNDALWDKILNNAINGINLDGITQEWERLAEKQLESTRKEELQDKDNLNRSTCGSKILSENLYIECVSNLGTSSRTQIENELTIQVCKEAPIVSINPSEEEFNVPVKLIRQLEERAAIIIQNFFIKKFASKRNTAITKKRVNESDCNDNKVDGALLNAFKDYENIYKKTVVTLNEEESASDKKDLAMAFTAAYSCLTNFDLSVNQVQKILSQLTENEN